MKTKPFLLALMIIMVMLNSCSKQKEVGFLMDNFIQERWTKDRDLFIDRVKELGGKVNLAVAEGDGAKQILQARQMLEQKIDVLVIVPVDQYAAANIVKMAHDFGVRVISYDRIIRNCDLDLYISFDNVEVGRLQADYLTRACPKGKYALIGGATSDNNSALIRLGQMNLLQPLIEKGDIQLVYDQFVNKWTQEEGYRCMLECLSKNGGRVDAVLAANDDLAAGALKAINEKKLSGKVFLAGQDADLAACQRIVMGTQTMTVYKPIEGIAQKAAELAMQMAGGALLNNLNMSVNNGKRMVPSILLPPMAVNQGTIRLTVIADGYLEENNIYKKK
jgi:D-xylose transport system substrate-binding protein